jgi:hypothetical protein
MSERSAGTTSPSTAAHGWWPVVGARSKAGPRIYRRWSNRISLIEDAAFSNMVEVPIDPTGDLRADLMRFLSAFEVLLDQPATSAAIPGLLAPYQRGMEPLEKTWEHLSLRPQLVRIGVENRVPGHQRNLG